MLGSYQRAITDMNEPGAQLEGVLGNVWVPFLSMVNGQPQYPMMPP